MSKLFFIDLIMVMMTSFFILSKLIGKYGDQRRTALLTCGGITPPDWFNRYQQTGMIAFECGDRIAPTP
tara:strand:+ start:606 stop:812 length:207 start_codon:yes stop_codon:yes gene_type:complete